MKRLALATLLALAACHGQQGSGVTLDADEDARNATGAKIDADLAAADAAARKPLPTTQLPRPTTAEASEDRPPVSADASAPSSDQDETDRNDDRD